MYGKKLNIINSRSFDIIQEFLFPFCNYIRNCLKMKIKLALRFHIFRSLDLVSAQY